MMNDICKKCGSMLNVFDRCVRCDAEKISTQNETSEIETVESNYCYYCKFDGKRQMVIIADLQAQLAKHQTMITKIEAIACGEEQIQADGVYDDSDGLKAIYDLIQNSTPKGEKR